MQARIRGGDGRKYLPLPAVGLTPPKGVGPTATVFEAYLKKVLTPSLRHGQSVVVDNLDAHKGERVRELIEERGVPTTVPAGVFAGLQSHRGSLLKDQGAFGEKPK